MMEEELPPPPPYPGPPKSLEVVSMPLFIPTQDPDIATCCHPHQMLIITTTTTTSNNNEKANSTLASVPTQLLQWPRLRTEPSSSIAMKTNLNPSSLPSVYGFRDHGIHHLALARTSDVAETKSYLSALRATPSSDDNADISRTFDEEEQTSQLITYLDSTLTSQHPHAHLSTYPPSQFSAIVLSHLRVRAKCRYGNVSSLRVCMIEDVGSGKRIWAVRSRMECGVRGEDSGC